VAAVKTRESRVVINPPYSEAATFPPANFHTVRVRGVSLLRPELATQGFAANAW
jgi:hypothetical protein